MFLARKGSQRERCRIMPENGSEEIRYGIPNIWESGKADGESFLPFSVDWSSEGV